VLLDEAIRQISDRRGAAIGFPAMDRVPSAIDFALEALGFLARRRQVPIVNRRCRPASR
jgi:hypothetical protein